MTINLCTLSLLCSLGIFWGPSANIEVLEPLQPPKDVLVQLISLQKASGSWDLVAELAEVFGKTVEEVVKQNPPQVGILTHWQKPD